MLCEMQSIDHHAVVELRCAGLVQVLCKKVAATVAKSQEFSWRANLGDLARAARGHLLGKFGQESRVRCRFAAASCRCALGDFSHIQTEPLLITSSHGLQLPAAHRRQRATVSQMPNVNDWVLQCADSKQTDALNGGLGVVFRIIHSQ